MTNPITGADSAEQVQWRNIQKVVRDIAAFCFGGPTQGGSVSMGGAYVAIVNSLTAKDGADLKLEPLPRAAAKVGANMAADVQIFHMAKLFPGADALYTGEFVRLSDVRSILAAGAPAETPKWGDNEWQKAEAISDLPDVDEALRGLLQDPTGDNATCVVRAVLRAAQPAPAPSAPKRELEGLMRNIGNAKYIKAYFDSAWALVDTLVAAPSAGADVEKDAWVNTREGLPIPAKYARMLYEGWKAQSGIESSFDEFVAKYGYFLSLDSIGACWAHSRGGPAIRAAMLAASSPAEAG